MSELHLDASRISGPDACRQILLVGEDNPLHGGAQYALYHEPRGCAGHRLQSKILGLRARQSYLPIWRTNLCVGGWDRAMAVDRAAMLVAHANPWRVVVMLGAKVGDAFSRVTQRREIDVPFTSTRIAGSALEVLIGIRGATPADTTFVALPHPSGRNTIWNDPAKVAAARALLATVAPGVSWGELDAGAERAAASR